MIKVRMHCDTEHVMKVRKALKDNGGYCPCAVEKSADTKCICKEFREQIERGESGMCHCGLYIIEGENK